MKNTVGKAKVQGMTRERLRTRFCSTAGIYYMLVGTFRIVFEKVEQETANAKIRITAILSKLAVLFLKWIYAEIESLTRVFN